MHPGGLRRVLAVALACAALVSCAQATTIAAADYGESTTRYPHLVLGRDHNWASLDIVLSDGTTRRVRLDEAVFEDTAPRLVDITGDGAPEVLVVESRPGDGARLAVYGLRDGAVELLVATPPVGRGNRWYAPVGAADLDGDGAVEIAFVDRPHLAKTLRIWRYGRDGEGRHRLSEVATVPNLTNHRIGDPVIWGGIRDCAAGPEMVLADADFSSIAIVRFAGDSVRVGRTALPPTAGNFDRVMGCGE